MPDRQPTSAADQAVAHEAAIAILIARQGDRFPVIDRWLESERDLDQTVMAGALGVLLGMLTRAMDFECARQGIPYQQFVNRADAAGRHQIALLQAREN